MYLKHSLVSSQDAQLMLQDGHKRTLQDYSSVKMQNDKLQGMLCLTEEENQILMTKALTQISLVTILQGNIAQSDNHIHQLVKNLSKLYYEKSHLKTRSKRVLAMCKCYKLRCFKIL